MAYLTDPKFNKKYPGFVHVAGGLNNANIKLTFEEGRFYSLPTEPGFALVVKHPISGSFQKRSELLKENIVILEFHLKEYKLNKNVNDQWVDVEQQPTETEVAICQSLLSNEDSKNLFEPFSGTFQFFDDEDFVEKVEESGVHGLIRRFKPVTENVTLPTTFRELIDSKVKEKGKSQGYASTSEADRAASRLKFVKMFVQEHDGLEKEPSIVECITSIIDSTSMEYSQAYLYLLDKLVK